MSIFCLKILIDILIDLLYACQDGDGIIVLIESARGGYF